MKPKEIELIVRAVMFTPDDKLVLCRIKGANWHFLPGGHVELGEPVEAALRREIHEETGIREYSVLGFAGVIENIYDLKGEPKHEVNVAFVVKANEPLPASQETHIEFVTIDPAEIDNIKILPPEARPLIKATTPYQNMILTKS